MDFEGREDNVFVLCIKSDIIDEIFFGMSCLGVHGHLHQLALFVGHSVI